MAFPPGAAHRSSVRSSARAPTTSPTSWDAALCGQIRPSARAPSSIRSTCHAPGTSASGRALDLAAQEADDDVARLVQRAHQREGTFSTQVAPPRLGDPVRVGVLQRRFSGGRLGKGVEERPDPVGETAEHRVRERHRTLETGAPDELDGLVHRRVPGDAVDEPELIGAEAKRRAHGRIEAVHATPPELLDRVVERAHALHRAERQPLRERAIAVVELRNSGSECAIGVRLVLEHPQQDVERGDAGGTYRRSPRSHASYAIRRPPSGCTSTGWKEPSSATRARQIVTPRPCSSARAPM